MGSVALNLSFMVLEEETAEYEELTPAQSAIEDDLVLMMNAEQDEDHLRLN